MAGRQTRGACGSRRRSLPSIPRPSHVGGRDSRRAPTLAASTSRPSRLSHHERGRGRDRGADRTRRSGVQPAGAHDPQSVHRTAERRISAPDETRGGRSGIEGDSAGLTSQTRIESRRIVQFGRGQSPDQGPPLVFDGQPTGRTRANLPEEICTKRKILLDVVPGRAS